MDPFNEGIKVPNAIFITFTFKKNNYQIFIDVDKNKTLGEALCILTNKYNLVEIGKMQPSFNGIKFTSKDLKRPLYELGIEDSSDISIWTGNKATEDVFADAKNLVELEQQKNQNQQINNQNFPQFNNFPNVNNFNNNNFNRLNNFPINPNFNNFQNQFFNALFEITT